VFVIKTRNLSIGRNSLMTEEISIAIKLDQDIMVKNMCVKFGEDWTNSFQELNRKQSSVRTDKGNPICRHFVTLIEP